MAIISFTMNDYKRDFRVSLPLDMYNALFDIRTTLKTQEETIRVVIPLMWEIKLFNKDFSEVLIEIPRRVITKTSTNDYGETTKVERIKRSDAWVSFVASAGNESRLRDVSCYINEDDASNVKHLIELIYKRSLIDDLPEIDEVYD